VPGTPLPLGDGGFQRHIYRMDSPHPHSVAAYRILEQPDGYRVEVSIPGASPVIVSGIPTLERAERWIAAHMKKVEAGAPKRVAWRLRQIQSTKQL
jgi:hypothetical protein